MCGSLSVIGNRPIVTVPRKTFDRTQQTPTPPSPRVGDVSRTACTLDLVKAQPTPTPTEALRSAIEAALPHLEQADETQEPTASMEAALSTFAHAVSPVLDDLAAIVEADPTGPTAKALNHLRRAFNHQGTGTISPACRWQMQRAHAALTRHS